jgi:hypothetical protein
MIRNKVLRFDAETIFENGAEGKGKRYHGDTVPAMPEWPATPTSLPRVRGNVGKEGVPSILASIIGYIPMK